MQSYETSAAQRMKKYNQQFQSLLLQNQGQDPMAMQPETQPGHPKLKPVSR